MSLHVVILAAGLGKRMASTLPKVLHPLAGKPLLAHVIDTAHTLNPEKIHIIYGHQGERVQEALAHYDVNWVQQTEQLGTGHALQQALPHLNGAEWVLVLYGDVPLISTSTLSELLRVSQPNQLGLLTALMPNPTGLGRIIRDDANAVRAIVEEKDATNKQKQIREIYSGILCAPRACLENWLPRIERHNAQAEFYLTDVVPLAIADDIQIADCITTQASEVQGVNDRWQLAELERVYQSQQAQRLAMQGVSFMDPQRFDCRGELKTGKDVTIDVNVVMEGQNKIGNHVRIGAHCHLKNVTIGDHVVIEPFSHIEEAIIQNECHVGPFARLRPGTELAEHAKIGNFVEIKKTHVGRHSKISHLSYIGDAEIGRDVNIGAGTITCNYDGVNKFKTIIEDEAFIGSDTQLIAPVRVGKRATIGAGSTLRKDAPADQLTVNDTKQKSYPGWKRPTKN